MPMNPRHGEVWMADLGMVAKVRPVVVLSDETAGGARSITIVIPVTSQNRGSDFEIPLGHLRFLNVDSVANVQGIVSVAQTRLERRLGILRTEDLLAIKLALKKACALS